MKTKKLVNQLDEYNPITVPYDVWRFVGSKELDVMGNQACLSVTSDFGTKEQLRNALDWYVDQLGGKVKWE